MESLYELVKNRSKYDGKSKTIRNRFDGISSEGKYTREEEETYILHGNTNSVTVEKQYHFQDDDGMSGNITQTYTTGRDILSILVKIFGE